MLSLAGGCRASEGDVDSSSKLGPPAVGSLSFRVGQRSAGKRATAPVDHYATFFATADGAGANYWLQCNLWAPCRVEARLGFFSPARAEAGAGTIGIALADWLGESGYHAVKVRRSGDGIEVLAGSQPDDLAGSVLLDGLVADVAIEHNGTDVVFLAGAAGGKGLEEILRRPATGPGPFRPSLDVLELPKGSEAGADGLRIVFNGLPPRPLTAAEDAARSLFSALARVLDAVYAADGAAPDLATARAALQQASAGFTDAAAKSAAVAELAKAGKKVGGLSKSALAIVKTINGGGTAAKVYKAAAKLAQKGIAAAGPYQDL
jgi:hypothetical protein